ncbi:adenylate/guanylate cyclase domain-containing protein [Nocardioides cavernaquae]|uniref:Adenylate/guanylate cyclase domain-containing protein n=1 Tax=Nocardioides cavernaquae TaxID=2321396 RepID=A0A3A5HB19_9ACTN|nr:adenylate/guanylate cyclase domain-containing protein [Nocardioides cavernaquae]RJS46605.1 adenylate/guanylate cyclase domain-containing protein [Nocardioides cavernaquae]
MPLPRDEHALDRIVLGGDPVVSARELAESLGMPLDELRRIWRTLGFPEADPDVLSFTDTDASALGLIKMVLDSGLIERDAVIGVIRSLGQTMARLADWDVTTLAPRAEPGESAEELAGRRLARARQILDEFGTIRDSLLVYAYRRHITAAIARILVVDEPVADAAGSADSLIDVLGAESIRAADVTVGFADLVGFTALSNELGEDRIGDLVEIFESRCHDVVTVSGGRLIKSLGDSVLFVAESPEVAMDIADGIVKMIGRDERMPDVRIGMASGPVSTRLGDVFGPAVNMAARLTAVARRNRIIIDDRTAELLPQEHFEVRRLPARPLRGFGLVEPVTVRRL